VVFCVETEFETEYTTNIPYIKDRIRELKHGIKVTKYIINRPQNAEEICALLDRKNFAQTVETIIDR
jgi:hypothetical protein